MCQSIEKQLWSIIHQFQKTVSHVILTCDIFSLVWRCLDWRVAPPTPYVQGSGGSPKCCKRVKCIQTTPIDSESLSPISFFVLIFGRVFFWEGKICQDFVFECLALACSLVWPWWAYMSISRSQFAGFILRKEDLSRFCFWMSCAGLFIGVAMMSINQSFPICRVSFFEKRRFVKILFLNVLRWPVHWWPLWASVILNLPRKTIGPCLRQSVLLLGALLLLQRSGRLRLARRGLQILMVARRALWWKRMWKTTSARHFVFALVGKFFLSFVLPEFGEMFFEKQEPLNEFESLAWGTRRLQNYQMVGTACWRCPSPSNRMKLVLLTTCQPLRRCEMLGSGFEKWWACCV